ncbi:type III-A CRISPR-associated protein Cas10/Csm1 [Faecalicoccus acidiformans]|uniref:type III-A CRISPR-associated protein Cas10/Csm1 n=1 Tax=Faecalicoccus acidiformans TaxID=915173 RepID=UPI00320908B8
MKYSLTECQFAALLHDIGKFGQRTRVKSDLSEEEIEVTPLYKDLYHTHLHSGYTSRFFQQVLGKQDELELLTSLHHKQEEDLFAKIIKKADQLASAIDRSDEAFDHEENNKKGNFIQARLFSVFEEVDFGKKRMSAQLPLSTIDDLGYPKQDYTEKNVESSALEYENLYNEFIQEVKKDCYKQDIDPLILNRMYALCYKYLTTIPASTYEGHKTNVSLFDHSKLTAAIAGCLYLNQAQDDHFYMYEFDVSGIQSFIYRIVEGDSTKPGIAKALRGRSIMVNLLTESIAYAILNEFNLHASNIIFNSGGGGTILLPWGEDVPSRVSKVEKNIKEKIRDLFAGNITFVSALVDLNGEELESFKVDKALELKTKLEEAKSRKDKELMGPDFFFEKPQYQNTCEMCGAIAEHKRCPTCKLIEKISDFYIRHSQFQIIYDFEKTKRGLDALDDFQIIDLGFVNLILSEEKGTSFLQYYPYIDSINDSFMGNVRCVANLVPKKEGQSLNFEKIVHTLIPVHENMGDQKLGILKMDVDNLGAVFAFGMKRTTGDKWLQRSLSKYLTLSRMLEIFFGKHLKDICIDVSKDQDPDICSQTDNKDMFYINYSGGDDLVVIGPAYGIIYLAKKIEECFKAYVNNENITISGGIYIQGSKEPIRFGVQRADDMLELSKAQPSKNHISLLECSLSFQEYTAALQKVEQYKKWIDEGVWSRTNVYNLMLLINDRSYSQYIRSIPLIQYSLYRNIDKKYNENRLVILRDFSKIKDDQTLKEMILILKLTIMFTRK